MPKKAYRNGEGYSPPWRRKVVFDRFLKKYPIKSGLPIYAKHCDQAFWNLSLKCLVRSGSKSVRFPWSLTPEACQLEGEGLTDRFGLVWTLGGHTGTRMNHSLSSDTDMILIPGPRTTATEIVQ